MLTNTWFIGIGGGILCGVVTYIIIYYFLSNNEQKHYYQKLYLANREILNTIRPMISKDDLLNIKFFNSIISSTANKHDISKNDLLSINTLIDYIITDIMKSQFLTIEQKNDYSKKLMKIKDGNNSEVENTLASKRDNISAIYLSLAISLPTAFFAILAILILQYIGNNELFSKNNIYVFVIMIIIPLFSLLIIQVLDYIRKIRRKNDNEKNKELEKEAIKEEISNENDEE